LSRLLAEKIGNTPEPRRRGLAPFILYFGGILVLAESALRAIAWLQNEIGWALIDRGGSPAMAGLTAALANGLITLVGLVALFAFFEWKTFGFTNFAQRYREGLTYGATAAVIVTIVQAAVFLGLPKFAFEPLISADQSGQMLIAFAVCYMLVVGLLDYWLHRALHDIPVLWRFHAIHHQIEHLNAARSYSHWGQDVLYLSIITVPLALIMESPEHYIAVLTTIYLVSNFYMHSDNPALSFPPALRHVLADNVYHHHHHSRAIEHWGRNYCSFFSFYDRIFGTQHMPQDEQMHPTGIDGYRPLSSWRDYLVRPFTKEG